MMSLYTIVNNFILFNAHLKIHKGIINDIIYAIKQNHNKYKIPI